MKNSRGLLFISFLNLLGVIICTIYLPDNVIYGFIDSLIVNQLVSKWFNLIIPIIQFVICFIIMLVDIKENGSIKHTYRYIITYIAIAVAIYYTWILIVIQFGNYNLGQEILIPLSTIILLPFAFFTIAYGYYQKTKKFDTASIFAFKKNRDNPNLWFKTHKFAGSMNMIFGVILFVIAILNDLIFSFKYIYFIILGSYFIIYYLFTLIYYLFISHE